VLATEDATFARELKALEETSEGRLERLKTRARELYRRREEERRTMANELMLRHFRSDKFYF
jgi:hypothetical protein